MILEYRRTHVVRPSDGKARIRIKNKYMYNVMQAIVAGLHSSHKWDGILVVSSLEKHIGRAEREILGAVAYIIYNFKPSVQLRIARIALLALSTPYRVKLGTARGFPTPTTGGR
jgi:hypothetical protein